ncbi:MAG: hypothetical protein FWH06_00590 [Oscillospiraceae bacterium]|nr:hypothetical protein [Oscillospiraceae bacterium]
MSKRRFKYIIKETTVSMLVFLVGSLCLTGFALLIGYVFKQNWAFSAPMLIVLLIWNWIKSVRQAFRDSKGM